MAGKGWRLAAAFLGLCAQTVCAQGPISLRVPSTSATSLADKEIVLPRDLPGQANVLILGFGRNSQDATTAWEKPVRTRLAQGSQVSFYDMAMLAEVPGLLRPLVIRSIRGKVPDVLKPNFLPLTRDEDAWKKVAGYREDAPDAAYILLVDKAGAVRWATHNAFSAAGFAELSQRAEALAGKR